MDKNDIATPEGPFKLGDWVVDPASCHIQRGGEDIRVEPKMMDVLLYLVTHAGQVVSRDELEAHAWRGMVVSYDALSSCIIKLRKALGDDSHHPSYIETVPKRGYRLIAPVSAVQSKAILPTSPAPRILLPVFALVLAIVAVAVALFTTNPSPPQEQASVVVLPFKNLSGDLQQDYFAVGIHDDIITDLSRIAALRVIANQSASRYLDDPVDLDLIARELKVQYVVQGSVQRTATLVRINVQLTHVARGEHIWAERFDSDEGMLFEVQDQISRQVLEAMLITTSGTDSHLLGDTSPSNFAAYDSFLQGHGYSRNRTRSGFEQAEEAYKQALRLDPDYARVYGALAVLYTNAYRHQWTPITLAEARERALTLAKKGVSLDESSPQAYWSLGFVHLFRKEFAEAEAAAQQAVNLSPNYADGLGLLAFISNWRGKAEQAITYIERATLLNPYYTFDYPWNIGLAYYTLGRYEKSVKSIEEALARNETAEFPRMFLAANYIRLGRLDDAEWEVEQVLTQRPETTLSHLSTTIPFEKPEHLQAFLQDMGRAGVPE
ncbi:MAG: winged helix-turn-helix domain-containing protein [Chromatiales bacterium]|nr:winged helix-turn-helix domain-containing protein [Chromatiales bacterium]